MKARINYRSKRTIIIISIAVVLLIAAIAGTVAFVKGNRDSAAAMTDDNPVTSQNDGTNAGLPNNGDQNNGSDQNNDGTTLPTDGDNTNPADSNNNDNNGSTTNDGTTGTNGANGSTTGTTNGANTGANAGTSTGTTTAGNNGANVPNQDYAQTTTVITENPWETKEIGWSPISVAAYTAASKLKVHKPDLDLQKYAYLDGDSLEELPVNTAAQKGETITYVIKITNKGNEDTNGIRTIDSIPEGTELASISEGGALNNDGKIVWKNDIKAGETVTVSFKVVVTADSIDLINNIAKVNGEETPETKTPVITANKTAQVVTKVDKEEVLENRDAKVGETIRYTITAKNTTEVDGTTVIKDSIPDGTSFVDGTITEKGNFDKENGTITWNNVVVPAKGEVSVSFDVVVNEKTTAGEVVKSVSNTATIGNTPTEEVETKVANITGTKSVDKTEAKVGETLTYTITLTNSGNGDGKVTVTDRVPEGTTIKDSEINGYDSKTNIMTWKDVEVKAGKSVELTFEVIVNDNTSIIKNKAYVDENKIPEEPETSVKHHYTVEHYTENLDGTYSKVEKDTVVSEDVEIGTKVSYKINNYDGFTFDESKTENKDSTVPDNNNLIVKLYYARRNDLSYTVYYKEQGTEKELAGAKVVDGQTFGDVVTENAIDIDGYNKVNPTSADITITTGTNEYTFYYTKRNDLSYTVYYKEQGTENELADAKLVNGQKFGDVVTENAIDIDGYNKVNPTNANITITTGKNEYTFYYTKRNDLSYTVYYKEQGTENELADAKVVDGQTFGNVVTENAIDIDGYNKVDPTSANITITTGKNEYTFYYTKRNDLSYTVYYKEQGTENELADAKVVNGQKFGDVVTENAIDIDGYNKVNPTSANITITTGKNEYTFYYTKRNDLSYTVNYLEKGTNNVLHEAKTVGNQTFGAEVTASVTNDAIEKPETIDGYNCVEVDKETLTIGTSTNEINFYYTKRTDLSYTVNYLEKGTNNVLHEAKTVENQTFGTVVSASVTNDAIEKPEAIDGYNCVEVDKETLTIGTSTNEINFYYTKRTDLSYTVNYYYNGELKHSVTFDNMEYLDEISGVEEMPKYNGVTYTKYDLKTSSANGLLPLIIGTGSNYINVYYGTPNVTISKKVNKTAVKVGDTLHYTIKVTETRGFVDASGVNVTDPISEGLENVRNITHNGKLNEGNVEWNNLAITKNSSITLEFDATVSAATIGKTISNTANLGGTMSGDSNTVTTTVSELKAAVKEVKKGTTGKDAVNIVLVMDLSYSMKSNKTSDGVTRLDAAKTAATKFINSIYTKDPKSKVTVTVLTFNTANPLTTIKYVGTERCTNNNIWHLHLNCKNIDGVWYSNWKEQKVAIPYSGTSKLGFADKTNYGALVNEINNISLPAENPDEGLGTNVSAALDLTKTTIGDLKDNHSENSNVVILLSDGAPTTSYSGNSSWNNYEGLRNQASEIKGNPITTEFYSIQFGTEDGAYDLLRAMSSNNTVYTSNSIDSLVKNFTNILDQNTTKDPIDTVNGKYTTTLSNPLVVDADNPITVTYKGTTLFTCTSLPNNGLTYDSTTKTISWDINAWNAVEGHTKVTTNDIVIQCYVER